MKHKLYLILVLTMAFLISISPAAAANTAVGSINTNDTDFNNATTLDNVSVTGSGNSASVQYRKETIDDFEDGDITTKSSLWNGWRGDTGGMTAQQNAVINGSWSANITSSGSSTVVDTTRDSTTTSNLSIKMQVNKTSGDHRVRIYSGGTSGTRLGIMSFESGDIRWFDGSFNTLESGYNAGEPYNFTFDFDFSNDQVTIVINDTNVGTFSFENSVSDWDYIDVSSNWDASAGGFNVTIDDVKVGSKTPQGTYIGQKHTVDDATQAFTDLSLTNTEATVTWQENSGGTWSDLRTDTYTTDGNKSVSINPSENELRVNVTFESTGSDASGTLDDEGVEFTNHDPVFDNPSAQPKDDEFINSDNVPLNITVEDGEFPTSQGDSVDVEFFVDGNSVGTDTLTSNGTAQVTWSATGGNHTWHADATDDYGGTATSNTFKFRTPGNVSIFNETKPDTKITDQVNVTFIKPDGIEDRSTTNGEFDFSGLPSDAEIIAEFTSEDFHKRTRIFEDIGQNETVFMLNRTGGINSVEVRFTLSDRTGQFEGNGAEIIISEPINKSGTNKYRVLESDKFGVAGHTVNLQSDQRYSIKIRNDDGDTRVLGKYTAPTSETVPLQVARVDINPLNESISSYRWNATMENVSGTETVKFRFNDSRELTSDMRVKIYERENASNEIYNQSHTGPFGSLTIDQQLSTSQENLTWIVEWNATRDGDTLNASVTVGKTQRQEPPPDMDPIYRHIIALGSMLVVGGLFSQVNAEFGAFTMAGVGGLMWYIGWMPGAVGGGVVFLALAVAVLFIVRNERTGRGV